MPVDTYVNTGQSVGEEVSSGGGGRVLTFAESALVHPSHTDGFVDGGDPVVIGDSVGVAMKGAAAATDMIAVDTEGLWWLDVVAVNDLGNVAMVAGEHVYINRTTAVLSAVRSPATQIFFGTILTMIASGTTKLVAVKVHQDPNEPQLDDKYLYVSKSGGDTYGTGAVDNPLLTIQAALDLCTATRKTIYVAAGSYDEALLWPALGGIKLLGMSREGTITISDSTETAAVITVAPGVQTETFEMWLENLYIDHGNAGQDGISLDNAAMNKKMNVYIRDCGGDADSATDRFIVTSHGDASNAIRIYWEGNNWGVVGRIYLDVGNDGDRFYATSVVLGGGFVTSADAIATDFRFTNCTILHEGVTGGNAAQLISSMGCFSQTGGTFAAVDTDDFAGSHTETVIVP